MVEVNILSNGIKIVSEKNEHVRGISTGIWVSNGASNEGENESGISHFIEHMLFKGTQKRTAKDIAEEMDLIGGQLNAFTGREYTCYHTKTLDSHFEKSIEILADMFFNSTFSEEEIEKEKTVVIEEISMYEDYLDELCYDTMQKNVYKNSSYGRNILGTKETVTLINREMCKKYMKKRYTKDNIVISVVGRINEDTINILEKYFGYKKYKESKQSKENIKKPIFNSAETNVEKDTEQLHLLLTYDGIKIDSTYSYEMAIFNNMFGGGLSSLLFQSIREQYGYAYSVYSQHTQYKESGLFNVYMALSPENEEKAIKVMEEKLKIFIDKKCDETMFLKAKENIKANYLLSLDSTTNKMNSIGRSMLVRGKVRTEDEILDKINEVTLKKIYEMVDLLFKNKKYAITRVGKLI